MDPLRIGIIGAGGITALLHVPELKRMTDGVTVTWLGGRRRSRLEHLNAELGAQARFSDDYRAIATADDVDAVIIATPHPLHVAPALAAIEAGKHVLVQKPLCASMDEADAFADAASAHPEVVVLAMPHFGPDVVAGRRMVDAGTLGTVSGAFARHSHGGPEVYYAEVSDAFGEPRDDSLWFFDAGQASVGALFDMGVYAVAKLVALLGSAVEVTGMVATVDKPTELEDTATLLVRFESGALGTAETGWVDPARTGYWRVHGSAGKLWSPGEQGAALTLWEPTSTTREHAPPKATAVDVGGDALGTVHQHFLACIERGEQPPLSSAAAARHVTEILLAGLQSSREQRTIALQTRAD